MPLYIYQLQYIKKFIIENNLNFDYVVKTRNDVQFSIKDSNKILNNSIYTFPIYWQLHKKYSYLNDHVFIISFDNFKKLNMSDENIINITKISWDCEEFNFNIIKPNTLIPDNLIVFYKTFGGCKISFIA